MKVNIDFFLINYIIFIGLINIAYYFLEKNVAIISKKVQ